jgi:hypothetical protein
VGSAGPVSSQRDTRRRGTLPMLSGIPFSAMRRKAPEHRRRTRHAHAPGPRFRGGGRARRRTTTAAFPKRFRAPIGWLLGLHVLDMFARTGAPWLLVRSSRRRSSFPDLAPNQPCVVSSLIVTSTFSTTISTLGAVLPIRQLEGSPEQTTDAFTEVAPDLTLARGPNGVVARGFVRYEPRLRYNILRPTSPTSFRPRMRSIVVLGDFPYARDWPSVWKLESQEAVFGRSLAGVRARAGSVNR